MNAEKALPKSRSNLYTCDHTYWECKRADLLIINVRPTSPVEEEWANLLCELADDAHALYAPDHDGTTDGSDGISALVLRDDLEVYRVLGERLGLSVEETGSLIGNGRYGDGQWNGYLVLSVTDEDDDVYVIDLQS